MIKALIFDFDGTVADTLPYTFAKITELAKRYQIKNKEEEIIEKIRRLEPKQLMKEFKISWFKFPIVIWEIRKAQRLLLEKINQIKIFPNLKKVLKELNKQGYLLFIYSSNIKKNIDAFLEKEKIDHLFKKIYTGNNLLGKEKDLRNILKKEGLKKEEVVYVADEARDVLACQKADIKMIGVSWGLAGEKTLQSLKVDFLVKEPAEILKILTANP